MSSFVQMDGQLLIAIQHLLVNDVLTPVMKAITWCGEWGICWIILSVVLMFFRRTRKLGILAFISLGIAFTVTNIWLKPMIARPRPWTLFEDVVRLSPDPGDWSFPSGHTTSAFATAAAIMINSARCQIRKVYGVAALTFATLMAISRLYLGMHFPSDVLAGVIIGITSALIVHYINEWRERRLRNEVSD